MNGINFIFSETRPTLDGPVTVPTTAFERGTDTIYVNPIWFQQHSQEAQGSILSHELQHWIVDRSNYNPAMDYVINSDLISTPPAKTITLELSPEQAEVLDGLLDHEDTVEVYRSDSYASDRREIQANLQAACSEFVRK